MDKVLALVLALVCSAAQALPTCWPQPFSSIGQGFTQGDTATDRFAGWWCPDADPFGDWLLYLIFGSKDYQIVHPPLVSLNPIATAVAYWDANVKPSDCAASPACTAARTAALATKPPSRWIVAPYTNATYRSTYAVTQPLGGARSLPAVGKVPILTNALPTPCDCRDVRVIEASLTYCVPQVPMAASAPVLVASCRLR